MDENTVVRTIGVEREKSPPLVGLLLKAPGMTTALS